MNARPALNWAAVFPIPMRGNETMSSGISMDVSAEFPIPMRGNEPDQVPVQGGGTIRFPIPMRGNERVVDLAAWLWPAVSNPHEG